MAKVKIYGIKNWRDVIKAAGQQIIDNADMFLVEGENVRSMEISVKGISFEEIPVIEVKKDYNIIKLRTIMEREDEV